MKLIYQVAILLYAGLLKAIAPFNAKAKLWVNGRYNWKIRQQQLYDANANYIWIHCASLGEFEQGRPVIEAIRETYPHLKIVLSFFSPSGYEIRKNYNRVDAVVYLPLDTPANAKAFLEIWKPKAALFIKYEFWLNYLEQLHLLTIPTFLIAANFRANQLFFKWYGGLFLKALKAYSLIVVQNERSLNLLAKYNVKKVIQAPDTRFDRVQAVANQTGTATEMQDFIDKYKVFMVGSAWLADLKQLTAVLNSPLAAEWKFVIVPHEIDEETLNQLNTLYNQQAVFYTRLATYSTVELQQAKVLIVDVMGQLAAMYRIAAIVFVGGGFGKSIHNILEPGVYGLPIIIGPKHHKFQEALDLIAKGGVVGVNNAQDILNCFEKWQNEALRRQTGAINSKYIQANLGGTSIIMNHLQSVLQSIA